MAHRGPETDDARPPPGRRKAAKRRFTLPPPIESALAPWLAPRIQGFVDRVIADEVCGWAFNRARPNRRVLVVARLGGKVVAECLADLPRRDLEESGRGDGRYGFRLKLPASLKEGERERVRIEAIVGLNRQELKLAARLAKVAPPSAAAKGWTERSAIRGPATGFLEHYAEGVLKGWAIDPNNPNEPPSVDLFDGELFLGVVQADIHRPRLQAAGAPSGARGFEFRMPAGHTADPGALRARISGSRFDLRRSKSYPGDGSLFNSTVAGDVEPETTGHRSPAAQPSASVIQLEVRDTVCLIVCGTGDTAAVEATLRSWSEQSWTRTSQATISPGSEGKNGSADRRLGPGDEQALRQLLQKAGKVVFAAPGVLFDPDLARILSQSKDLTQITTWPVRNEPRPILANPALAAHLGAHPSCLAVSAPVLRLHLGPLAPPSPLWVQSIFTCGRRSEACFGANSMRV